MTTETLPDSAKALVELRKGLDATQDEFAHWMGVPRRTLQELENGRSRIRAIHIRAAQMAALWMAREKLDIKLLKSDLRNLVSELSLLS